MKSLYDLSTSTSVYGVKPPNQNWLRMKAVWDACSAAGIALPREVDDFFNGEDPDPAGVIVDLSTHSSVKVWSGGEDSMREGIEVDVELLPADVTVVRFVNFY